MQFSFKTDKQTWKVDSSKDGNKAKNKKQSDKMGQAMKMALRYKQIIGLVCILKWRCVAHAAKALIQDVSWIHVGVVWLRPWVSVGTHFQRRQHQITFVHIWISLAVVDVVVIVVEFAAFVLPVLREFMGIFVPVDGFCLTGVSLAAVVEAAEDEPDGMQQSIGQIGVEDDEEDGSPNLTHAKKPIRPQFGEVIRNVALTPPWAEILSKHEMVNVRW